MQSKPLLIEQIRAAAVEHGVWKSHLRLHILRGQRHPDGTSVKFHHPSPDDAWFVRARVPASMYAGNHFRHVTQAYGRFHDFAIEVTDVAEMGRAHKAKEMLLTEGQDLSDAYLEALQDWRLSLKKLEIIDTLRQRRLAARQIKQAARPTIVAA